MDYSLW